MKENNYIIQKCCQDVNYLLMAVHMSLKFICKATSMNFSDFINWEILLIGLVSLFNGISTL